MAFGKSGFIGTAFVEIRAQTEKAIKDVDKLGRDLDKQLTARFSKLGQNLGANVLAGATVGLTAAIAGIGASIEAAAGLGEAENVSQLVFGDAQAEIEKFALAANEVAGLSDRAALDATSGFGKIFDGLEFGQEATVQWSKDLTVLAADMASAFGVDTQKALDALGDGLTGDTKKLEDFNIVISEAQLNQRAVALGLAATTAEVSDHARAQAALAEITERTADVSGEFARNLGDSLGGQIQVFKSELEDVAAQLGEEFLPLAIDLVSWASEELPGAIDAAIPKLVAFTDVVLGVGVATKEVAESLSEADFGGGDFFKFLTGGGDDSDGGRKELEAIWGWFRGKGEDVRTRGSAINEVTSAWQGRIEAARNEIDGVDSGPIEDVGEATLDAAEKAEILEDAWSNLFDLFSDSSSLDEAESELIELRQSIEEQINDGGNTGINLATEQGRENRENVRDLAEGYVDVAEKSLDAGQGVDEVNRRLQQQREFLVLTAESFGASREEAEAYVDETLNFPTELHTDVTVDDNGSIARTNAELDAIERRRLFVEMIITSRGGPGGNGLDIPDSHSGSIRRREEPVLVDRDQWIVPNDPAGAARTARLRDSAGNTLNDVLGQTAASSVPQINNFNISTPNLDAEQTAHYIRQTFNEYAGA